MRPQTVSRVGDAGQNGRWEQTGGVFSEQVNPSHRADSNPPVEIKPGLKIGRWTVINENAARVAAQGYRTLI